MTVVGPEGRLLVKLNPGDVYRIRQGSQVLTLSLSSSAPGPRSSLSPGIVQLATHLLTLINRDRADHGAGPLALDPAQSACSLQHTRSMVRGGALSHGYPADVCVPHTTAGENVGYWSGDPLAALTSLEQGMMSEGPCPHPGCPGNEARAHGHYLNIVNPVFKHIGIGVVVRGGTTWLTEDFTG